jgi:hypothetical protein
MLLFESITIPRVNVKHILNNDIKSINLQSNLFKILKSSFFFYLNQRTILMIIDNNSKTAVSPKNTDKN